MIRDDENMWQQIEQYIESKSDAQFSHGICPECAEKLYGDSKWYKDMQQKNRRVRDPNQPESQGNHHEEHEATQPFLKSRKRNPSGTSSVGI